VPPARVEQAARVAQRCDRGEGIIRGSAGAAPRIVSCESPLRCAQPATRLGTHERCVRLAPASPCATSTFPALQVQGASAQCTAHRLGGHRALAETVCAIAHTGFAQRLIAERGAAGAPGGGGGICSAGTSPRGGGASAIVSDCARHACGQQRARQRAEPPARSRTTKNCTTRGRRSALPPQQTFRAVPASRGNETGEGGRAGLTTQVTRDGEFIWLLAAAYSHSLLITPREYI
jgi:hypothetical protein